MDLWIRSRDRETLMKVNRIDIENNSIICYDNDYHCNETYMGTYETKERALEVLDEIQDTLEYVEMVELNSKKEMAIGAVKIYEMPLE